jgi:hypothetical protein
MVHRCKILVSRRHPQVVLLHLRVLNRLPEVSLPEKVHHPQLLTIQIIHLQINLLHKVAVANPKQVKSKQPVIALAKQVLV